MKSKAKRRKTGGSPKAKLKDQWQAQWQAFSKKFDEAKREGTRLFALTKKKYAKSLRDLDRQRQRLRADLKKLAGRSDLAWGDVKRGFKAAARDVDRAVKKAVLDFKKIS